MSKILLIEPDRVLAASYFGALKSAGHDVNVAPGAQSAIMAADRSMPDLVILELQLIGHSGIEFLYELKSYSEWQNIKVIILSQVKPAEFRDSMGILKNQLGVVDFLYKPGTTLKDLVSSVNHSLNLIEV